MNKSNTTNQQDAGGEESVSRRVADELHERIDQVAEKSEKLEQKLHESGAGAKTKARELNSGLATLARDNPWLVVGGSVVLGMVLSSFLRR